MKKLISLLSLVGLMGVSAVALVSANNKNVQPAQATTGIALNTITEEVEDEPLEKHIDVERLIPNRAERTVIRDKNATYWGDVNSYSAVDRFYDSVDNGAGETSDPNSVSSILWTQKRQYVHFQWGAANDAGQEVYLNFHYYDLDGNVIKNGDVDVIDMKLNTTFNGNIMMVHYHQVNDYVWENYGELGFQMKVELVDNFGGSADYKYHLFGNFHANQTWEDICRTVRGYLKFINLDSRGYEGGRKDAINGHYGENGNALLKAVMNSEYVFTDVSTDFEEVLDFYGVWSYDDSYQEGINITRHFDKVISYDEYRPAETRMPFNQDGKGFFRGWYETAGGQNSGFVSTDELKYRFYSEPVTLNSDYVSIKLAGKASLQVLTGDRSSTLLEVKNQKMSEQGEFLVHNGFNTVTMINHVINVSAYKGDKVIFAISDYDLGGWSAAYFDSFNQNYNPLKGFAIDEVVQVANDTNTYYTYHYDHYTSTDDGTDICAAYKLVTEYKNNIRANAKSNICGVAEDEGDLKAKLSTFQKNYNDATDAVRAIVNASGDYSQYDIDNPDAEMIRTRTTFDGTIYETLAFLSGQYGLTFTGVNSLYTQAILFANNNGTTNIIIIVTVSLIVLALGAYLLNKKRKLAK